jgi:hypothetical protein
MTFSPHALSFAISVPLIALLYYRRFRRSFGRQPVQPGRMITRVVILCLVGGFLLLGSVMDVRMFAGEAVGLVAGVGLGFWGLKLTRFERKDDGVHYIPHSWFGIGITVLLLARLAYRWVVMWPAMHAAQAGIQQPPYPRSPLTLALFGLLVGYYTCYYIGVLSRAKKQPVAAA